MNLNYEIHIQARPNRIGLCGPWHRHQTASRAVSNPGAGSKYFESRWVIHLVAHRVPIENGTSPQINRTHIRWHHGNRPKLKDKRRFRSLAHTRRTSETLAISRTWRRDQSCVGSCCAQVRISFFQFKLVGAGWDEAAASIDLLRYSQRRVKAKIFEHNLSHLQHDRLAVVLAWGNGREFTNF